MEQVRKPFDSICIVLLVCLAYPVSVSSRQYSESASKFPHDDKTIPLFSAAELAPTYHDGANGAVLGCPSLCSSL